MRVWNLCASGALLVAGATLVAAGSPSTGAPRSAGPGWIGSISGTYEQSSGTVLHLPSGFAPADLLVAIVANDGPDSATSVTHAGFGGTSGLTWICHGHVSARQDWAVSRDRLDRAGASSAEIWTAAPPVGWTPGTVTEISSNPEPDVVHRDDGGVVTITAWANGQLGQVLTVDGVAGRPLRESLDTLGPGSAAYAAIFTGRVNAAFTPLAGFHTVISRRAGDDTAQVIASNNRDLPSGIHSVGYAPTPGPGNYWEMAVVEITPR